MRPKSNANATSVSEVSGDAGLVAEVRSRPSISVGRVHGGQVVAVGLGDVASDDSDSLLTGDGRVGAKVVAVAPLIRPAAFAPSMYG